MNATQTRAAIKAQRAALDDLMAERNILQNDLLMSEDVLYRTHARAALRDNAEAIERETNRLDALTARLDDLIEEGLLNGF